MKRILLFAVLSTPISAAVAVESCRLTTAQEILNCALKHRPDVLLAETQMNQGDALEKAARQRPNPEVESESTFPNDEDQPSLKLQAGYLHPFELGGKRFWRIKQARARKESFQAKLDHAKEQAAIQTVLNLYRLRQVETELHANEEALKTYGKIIRLYRSRTKLPPELEVSLHTFIIAENDSHLRRASLLQEQESLEKYFMWAVGADTQTIVNALPLKKTDWPVIQGTDAVGGAARKEFIATVGESKTSVGLANSESWPNLRAGPFVDLESGRGKDNQGYGAVVSLPLPLFSLNQGGRAVAKSELDLAELTLAQEERRLRLELSKWQEIYRIAVDALERTQTVFQMEEKHQNMESLFERGLVAASLVIEVHRQMIDFVKDQNEQELKGIEALWSIYALQGKILEAQL